MPHTKFDLSKLHTRELMSWRQRAYANNGRYRFSDHTEIAIGDILAELNTREHVPNKKEAKELRRLAAKQGK